MSVDLPTRVDAEQAPLEAARLFGEILRAGHIGTSRVRPDARQLSERAHDQSTPIASRSNRQPPGPLGD